MAKMVNLASLLTGTSPAQRFAATPPRGAAAESADMIVKVANWDRSMRKNIVESAIQNNIDPASLGNRSKRYSSAKTIVEVAKTGSISGTAAMIVADIRKVLFPSLSVIGPEGLKKSVKLKLSDVIGVDGAAFVDEQIAQIIDCTVDDKGHVELANDEDETVLVGQHSALLAVIEGPLEANREAKDAFTSFKASFGTPVEAQVIVALRKRYHSNQEVATEVATA